AASGASRSSAQLARQVRIASSPEGTVTTGPAARGAVASWSELDIGAGSTEGEPTLLLALGTASAGGSSAGEWVRVGAREQPTTESTIRARARAISLRFVMMPG